MRNPTVVEVIKVMARQALEFFISLMGILILIMGILIFIGFLWMVVTGLTSLVPGHGMTGGELWAGRGALGVLVLIGGTVWYTFAAEKVKSRKARERGSWFE